MADRIEEVLRALRAEDPRGRPVILGPRHAVAIYESLAALELFLARLPRARRRAYPYGDEEVRHLRRLLLEAYPELRPILAPDR